MSGPRYMIAKRLADGSASYYWNPRKKDIERGCALRGEALGRDYPKAAARAEELNAALDEWREGRGLPKMLARHGTVDWWIETYKRSDAFATKVSERSRPGYERRLQNIADMPLKTPVKGASRLGELPVKSLTPAAVDKLYRWLRGGENGSMWRKANEATDIGKRAWTVVQRGHPELFYITNPFVGLVRSRTQGEPTKAASREEAYALSQALVDYGHPHLAAAPLICFEWLQRPENVLAGMIKWTDYHPGVRVRIVHHKTGEIVDHLLYDADGLFYPEIETYLSTLDRLGTPIVLGRRKPHRLYSRTNAQRTVRRARRKAGLPEYLTLEACRHGGLTELGDAELTEQQGMALSAHKTASSYRLYVKRTERQRLSATRKRRAWVESEERIEKQSQNEGQTGSQNEA